jgi:outer membrane protein assembly factor BamB
MLGETRQKSASDKNPSVTPILVDPFGVHGTRSGQRWMAARRRRMVQQIVTMTTLIAMAGAAIAYVLTPHLPVIAGSRLGHAAPPAAPPLVVEDSLGVALLTPTEGGDLLRFDPQSGTAQACLSTAFPLRATPLSHDNIAFVPSEDGVLYAVDWRRGKTLWQRATGAPLTARPAWAEITTATPALTRKKLVVIGNDAGLVSALEAGNGRPAWQRKMGAPVGNGITMMRGAKAPAVLVPLLEASGHRGGLACLDARSGALLWKYPGAVGAPAPQVAPPAVDNATGRVFCGDDSGAVTCLDGRTGRKIWKTFARPAAPSRESVLLRGEPLFRSYAFGSLVVIGGNDGFVRAFNAENGALRWQFDSGAPLRSRPFPLLQSADGITRELLMLANDSSLLWVLDPQSGQAVCKLRAQDAVSFSPQPLDDRLCTINASGVVEDFVF